MAGSLLSYNWEPEDIKILRYRMGLNQEEFAERAGTATSTIARWEMGSFKPSPLAVYRLETLRREKDGKPDGST